MKEMLSRNFVNKYSATKFQKKCLEAWWTNYWAL